MTAGLAPCRHDPELGTSLSSIYKYKFAFLQSRVVAELCVRGRERRGPFHPSPGVDTSAYRQNDLARYGAIWRDMARYSAIYIDI